MYKKYISHPSRIWWNRDNYSLHQSIPYYHVNVCVLFLIFCCCMKTKVAAWSFPWNNNTDLPKTSCYIKHQQLNIKKHMRILVRYFLYFIFLLLDAGSFFFSSAFSDIKMHMSFLESDTEFCLWFSTPFLWFLSLCTLMVTEWSSNSFSKREALYICKVGCISI